jgi:hypothetical protein
MESTAAQQKIAGLQNLVSGGKFSLDGISSWLKKADTAADYNASLGLGPVPEAVASGTPEYVAGRVARPERGMLSKLHTRVGAAGRQLGKVTGLGGKIGPHALGYGAAGLGAAGLYGLYRLLAGGEPAEKTGSMNKKATDPELLKLLLHSALIGAGTGGAVGAGVGALASDTGKGWEGAGRGALYGAGAGALFGPLGGAAGYFGRGKNEEEKKVASNERLGTPFTDGFLSFCIKHKLDGEKVAEMIEKGAALEGKTGQECKGFLDRVLSK